MKEFNHCVINKLCGRSPQYTPSLRVDLGPFDRGIGVRVARDVCGMPILVFLSLCSRLRPDERERQTDRQTSDAHHRLIPLPADNRCITARPHHTDTATAPLATSTTTCRLQDRRPGFPVPDRSGTGLPGGGGGLSARRDVSVR